MSSPSSQPHTPEPIPAGAIRLRLVAAMVALAAGVVALVVAIMLVRNALG